MGDLEKVFELIAESGISILPVTSAHILSGASLGFHHRGPFDWLIIAQTKREHLALI